ncbi:MAG: hypothetical protein KAY16_00745 [Spirochaetes bacterium]|nr:hypothetical protein [Spirochaetota bacterium]
MDYMLLSKAQIYGKCVFILFFLFVLFTSFIQCSSFMSKDAQTDLKKYEGEYIILTDASRDEYTIPKGERVRIKIIATDDYIKIYAMSAKSDFVKGEWILILYLFPDDFEKEKFNQKVFEDKLYQVLKPVK